MISVASGKGGTGKTMVAVSLALAATEMGESTPLLMDCDVEEPNCALFLDLDIRERIPVGISVPEVDPLLCDQCGRCSEVCSWNAIAVAGEKVLVFSELCHGCGSCTLLCPRGAITESMRVTGNIESGTDGRLEYAGGVLDIGRAMPVPVISQLMERFLPANDDRTVIIDSSPGTSCPMVAAVRPADLVLLVTEPTPFGLHDLAAAVRVVRDQLEIPAAVIVNRLGTGNGDVIEFCRDMDLPVLAGIPMDRRIAETLSEGIPLVRSIPEYVPVFREILAAAEDIAS